MYEEPKSSAKLFPGTAPLIIMWYADKKIRKLSKMSSAKKVKMIGFLIFAKALITVSNDNCKPAYPQFFVKKLGALLTEKITLSNA